MKLSYFDLLSPEPIYIENVGGILSPKLKDISGLKGGVPTYNYFLSTLILDIKSFFDVVGQTEQYDSLSDEEKTSVNVFDLLTMEENSINLLQTALNFFIKEQVIFSADKMCFYVVDHSHEKESVIGLINRDNYCFVTDIICQRNNVRSKNEESISKPKSKKALEIMKKLQKGRENKARSIKPNENMELGNIISAVSSKHPSLNILNVWDLTVYQLWDTFSRISNNTMYDIMSMQVAAYGNKDNQFDLTSWFQKINQ